MAMFESSSVLRQPFATPTTPDISPNEVRYLRNEILSGQTTSSVVDGCVICDSFFANNPKAGDVYKSAVHELHLRCKWPTADNSDLKRLLQAIETKNPEREAYRRVPTKPEERVKNESSTADGQREPTRNGVGVNQRAKDVQKSEVRTGSFSPFTNTGNSETVEAKRPIKLSPLLSPLLSPMGELMSPTSDYFGEDFFANKQGRAITKKVQQQESSSPATKRVIKDELVAIGTERQRDKGYQKLPSRLQYPSGPKTPLSSPQPIGLPSPLQPVKLPRAEYFELTLGSPIGSPTPLEWKPLVTATKGEDITSDPFLGITMTPPPTIKNEDLLWPTRANIPVPFSTPGPKSPPFSKIPYPFGKFGVRPIEQDPITLNGILSPDVLKLVETLLIPSPDGRR